MPKKTRADASPTAYLAAVKAAIAAAEAAAKQTYACVLAEHPVYAERKHWDYWSHWLYVASANYPLRTVLKTLGATKVPPRGWEIPCDLGLPITEHQEPYRAACQAACDVLQSMLGADGEFHAHTWLSD